MSKLLALDAKVKAPRGQAHYWRVICELDRDRAWTISDVELRSNGDRSSVRDFIRRLVAGGYAKVDHATGGVDFYCVAKASREAPRLRRDGSEIPEPLQERLWRAMKLVKTFSAAELAGSIEPAGDLVATDSYCKLLARAGVLAIASKGTKRAKATYRLLLADLGPIAPKILATKLVYDANANRILGVAEGKEAS